MNRRLAAALLTVAALGVTAGCGSPAAEGPASGFPQATATAAPNTGAAPADTTWLTQYGTTVQVGTPVVEKNQLGQFLVKLTVTNTSEERVHPSAIIEFYDGNGSDVGGGPIVDDATFYLNPGQTGVLVLEGGVFTEAYETYDAEMTTYLPMDES